MSESYGNRKIPCLTSDYARLEDKAIETNDCDKDVKLKILVKTRTVTNTKIDGKNWNNLHLIRFKEVVGIQGRRMRMKTRGFKVLFRQTPVTSNWNILLTPQIFVRPSQTVKSR